MGLWSQIATTSDVEAGRDDMKAVILAAGPGRRLGMAGKEVPKCLLRVGDETILRHQRRLLESVGIPAERTAVVVGHRAELVEASPDGEGLELIYAPDYTEMPNTRSLWEAREWIGEEPVLVLNGDTLFSRRDIGRLAEVSVIRDPFAEYLTDTDRVPLNPLGAYVLDAPAEFFSLVKFWLSLSMEKIFSDRWELRARRVLAVPAVSPAMDIDLVTDLKRARREYRREESG